MIITFFAAGILLGIAIGLIIARVLGRHKDPIVSLKIIQTS